MIRIEHMALYCVDLEAMKEFFVRYFDAVAGPMYHNATTGFRSYFLSFAGGGARLEIMCRPTTAPTPQPPYSAGYHHLSISVGSRAAVDALTARLVAHGYPCTSGPRTTGDGYYESTIQGPEAISIEITQ
ncbi:MAG: VOC family protein [Bacteroidales bacterium]|nr:VOC family protein [Bacteroidales bacterium]